MIDRKALSSRDHFVQFYELDDQLIEKVVEFISAALSQHFPVLVIATRPHLNEISSRLRSLGRDPDHLEQSAIYYPLDAHEVLSRVLIDGMPDPVLFEQALTPLILKAITKGPLRAFGEMVGVLSEQGNSAAAIHLEGMWEHLQERFSFSLFCAYPMSSFNTAESSDQFDRICQAHSHVIPPNFRATKSSSNEDNLRDLAYLQQKAAALESEIQVRKHFEHRLAIRENELREFLETATEGIHQVGPDGTILWANKAELEMFGYQAHEYIGHDIREFHADVGTITEILCKLGRGEKLYECESRIRHKNGSIIDVSINSSVYWENDKFAYTRCFTRDITAQKKATELLEQKVAERTARLQETISELEAFSYSISHDLRAPLRAINGYASSIREDYGDQLPADALDRLERIENATDRLDMLARDILSYTRVSKENIPLHPIPLTPLLRDIVHQLDNRKPFHVAQPEALPVVMGHEACLVQCISNLLDNAIKFVPAGSTPDIRVASELNGERVRINVIDNGIGIAPEHHASLFKLFGRLHPSHSYAGTGLGLAIVAKAVHRMGGAVGFNSEPGKGSTFWFELNVAPEQESSTIDK